MRARPLPVKSAEYPKKGNAFGGGVQCGDWQSARESLMNKPERLTSAVAAAEFQVGGVNHAPAVRIRRLGHFGVNVANPEKSKDFYCRLLGFRVSDPIDFGPRLPRTSARASARRSATSRATAPITIRSCFFPRDAYAVLNPHSLKPSGTLNQITWQVGSLQEVSDAFDWFTRRGKQIRPRGPRSAGIELAFYPPDPDGHTNELYYGIEQIGWDGYSKPREMYGVRYTKPPQLPHRSEYAEVMQATKDGIAIEEGLRASDMGGPETYDVGGILLARPFKIARIRAGAPLRRGHGTDGSLLPPTISA